MTEIDLTPFGFTPTENLVYRALLEQGPSGGYALAKKLNIARANAYQALNGLVNKRAATASEDKPQRYRVTRPDALFARLLDIESKKLDLLETQVQAVPPMEGAELVAVEGHRALVDLSMRTGAREAGPVTCVAPRTLVAALAPVWRRRLNDNRESRIWIVGSSADAAGGNRNELPIEPAGIVNLQRPRSYFAGGVFLLTTSESVIAARTTGMEANGYWSTDPTIVGLVRAAVDQLIRAPES